MRPQQSAPPWPQSLLQSPQTVSYLHLYDSRIASLSSIAHLSQCVSLTDLNLHCNLLTSLAPTPSFSFSGAIASSLLHLDLSSNQITRIEGLDSLIHLQTLNLASNQVSHPGHNSTQQRSSLIHLTHTRFPRVAQISAVTGLQGLLHLVKLTLSYNSITSLEGRNERETHPSQSLLC